MLTQDPNSAYLQWMALDLHRNTHKAPKGKGAATRAPGWLQRLWAGLLHNRRSSGAQSVRNEGLSFSRDGAVLTQ